MRIIIRADGSNFRGMGHISKQIILYNKLVSLGHQVLFLTKYDENSIAVLKENNIKYQSFKGDALSDISSFVEEYSAKLIILDILNTTQKYIQNLKQLNVKLITFDNTDQSAFLCDLIFNVMYFHKNKQISKALYEGSKYIIMDDKYRTISSKFSDKVKTILLTQGGADTTNKIPFLLNILIKNTQNCNIEVVIGPVFDENNIKEIEEIASRHKRVILHYKPNGLFDLVSNADLVVSGGGTTMWEVAALKTPMYIFINEDFEDETARLVEGLGFALYDGYNPKEALLEKSINNLLENNKLRKKIFESMSNFDIANGCNRIIEIINKEVVNV